MPLTQPSLLSRGTRLGGCGDQAVRLCTLAVIASLLLNSPKLIHSYWERMPVAAEESISQTLSHKIN